MSAHGSGSVVVLRHATPSDVEPIVDIEQASFEYAGERFGARRVRYLITHQRFVVLVAQRHGSLLGWAAGFVHRRSATPWGRIYAIAVDPRARGQKVGRRLMERMLEILGYQGAQRIFLEVRSDNRAAMRLYEKLGFSTCRTLPNYYGPGLAAARMARITGPSPPAIS